MKRLGFSKNATKVVLRLCLAMVIMAGTATSLQAGKPGKPPKGTTSAHHHLQQNNKKKAQQLLLLQQRKKKPAPAPSAPTSTPAPAAP